VEDVAGPSSRFGALLKKIYLDELPQILNIVKGDLGFVGPRHFPLSANRARLDEEGKAEIGDVKLDYRVHDLLPGGLTGLYQTNKSERALHDYTTFMQEGAILDNEYYRRLCRSSPLQVVLMDLSIIFGTFRVVLEHKGV